MTRLKKFISATLMVLVTVFSYLGTAVVNVARSIFSFGTASALEPGKNTNEGATVQGDIVSVPGFEKSIKKGESVTLPYGGDDGVKVTLADLSDTGNVDVKNVFVQIVNNYGEELTTWVENEGTKLAGYEDTSSQAYLDASAQVTIDANGITLKPNQSGTYKVKYYVLTTGNVWTSTSSYDIEVSAEDYKLDFMANDATVMPTMFDSEKDQTIDIALPLVYDENGDVITEDIVLGGDYGEVGSEYHYVLKYEDVAGTDGVSLKDVTKLSTEDTNIYKEYKTYTVKKVNGSVSTSTAKYNLRVSIALAGGVVLNNYDSATRLESANATAEGGVYDLNPYSFSTAGKVVGGKNIVTYNLYKMEGGNVYADAETYITHTITGSKSFDDEISVVASVSSKLKSSDVSYRERADLPKVNAVNSNDSNNSVSAFYYYKVQVESGDDLVSDVDSVVMGRDEKGFYFIPKAARSSYYDISYVAVDAFGNSSKDSNKDDNYTIQVWDNNPPKAVFTSSYDMTEVDQSKPSSLDKFEDISYVIPSKIATGNDAYLRIPALAASDYSGLSSAYRRLYSSAFLKNGTKVSSSKYLTITDATDGLPTQNSDIGGDINEYLHFVDYQGRHINAAGYYVSSADHSVYVNENGVQVDEDNKVFAFKDATSGEKLTGTKLRDAVNACEAYVKLDPAIFGEGTYSLFLSAQDIGQNRLNTNRENKFELVAELDDSDKTTPVVEFANANITEVGAKSKVKIAVPTAKDDVDTRLNVKYYLNISNTLYEVKAEDGYIEFAMSDKADETHTYYQLAQVAGSFKVVAYAFNDYSTEIASLATATDEELSDAHIGHDEYTISVKKATDVMPTFTAIEQTTGTPTQFEDFEVKGFTFHDDTNTARVRATVTDTNGNSYSATDVGIMTITGDAEHGYDYVYGGIKFKATNADKDNYYTVTYEIIDGAYNVISYSIVLIHAVDKTGPTITGLTGTTATIELGQQYSFSKLKAVDNYSDTTTITAEVKDSEGNNVSSWFNMSNLTFSPRKEGTYTIKFTARDLDNNPSQEKTFTVTVKDTLAPVIKLNGATSDTLLYPESTIEKVNDEDVFSEVELPTFSVSDTKPDNVVDSLFTDTATGKITVTAPKKDSNSVSTYTFDMSGNILNSVVNTLGFKKDGNKYVFTPTNRGAYTVTYSASDAAGREASSKVITVNVGDTESPQIFLVSDLKSALENGFVLGENASLVINNNAVVYNGENVNYNAYSSFYVKDNAGFDSTTDTSIEQEIVTVTVKITNSNGTEVSSTSTTDNKLHYDFTTAGQYTMTLTVTDKVGNKETMTKTFTVSAKESSKSNSSAILGTILIIVSALILAGVIIYFVRGTKMLPKNNKKANKKED